jgi:hypothetical protein
VNIKKFQILVAAALFLALPLLAFAQKQTDLQPNRYKRTVTKTERTDLSPGGTVTVVGAPVGSIAIEAWQQPMVEVTAEIALEAPSEADLALLAQVNNFNFDADLNHVRILTTGTHDKAFLKKSFKKFPKNLLTAAWRVDYKIKVPAFTDLDVNAGRGDFALSGVEGAILIQSLEAENVDLNLNGGAVQATFGSGNVRVKFGARSWRGRGAEIQVARGELDARMPPDLNAEINAEILRTGKIENAFETLKPRDRTKFTDKMMLAKAGAGGARLAFTVGDGTLRLKPQL